MSFYFQSNNEFVFVPFNLLAVDFEFVTSKITEKKGKKYFQEIVEVGAVFRDDDGEKEISSIIKPKHFIDIKNKKKSIYGERFSCEDMEKGRELEEFFKDMKNIYSEEEAVWISWGKAEFDILRNVCKKYNIAIPFLKKDYLDLCEEFSKFYNIDQNVSLDKALTFLNISSVNRHFALWDAKAVMKIIYKMFSDGYIIEEREYL